MLVSFDVVSLFTNIPTDLALDVARRRLLADETLPDRTNLTVDSLVSLLEFCLNATYLTFRSTHYQQFRNRNGLTSLCYYCQLSNGRD